MRYRVLLTNTIVVCIVLLSAVKPASARDKERALKHFKAGNLLVETDNYAVAAKEFESSVDLYPTKNGYFNLANCYLVMHRYKDALAAINKLKEHFRKKLDGHWLEEIETFEKKFKKTVAKLEIHVNIDGVQVQIDNETVGESPLGEQLLLKGGDHEITVFRKGYETVTQKVSLKAEETTLLHLFLERKSEASGSLEEEGSEQKPEQKTTHPVLFDNDESTGSKRKPRVWTAISLSVGGAAGISAIITGVVHLARVSDLRDKCDEKLCNPEYKSDLDDIKRLGTATNVLIGVSAFGLVLGTILAFVEKGDDESDEGIAFSSHVLPEGLGLSMSGKF